MTLLKLRYTLNKKNNPKRRFVSYRTLYSSIPGNRNWQTETADWNLDVRLDILGFRGKETLCAPRNIAFKLAGCIKNRGFYFPGCYCTATVTNLQKKLICKGFEKVECMSRRTGVGRAE